MNACDEAQSKNDPRNRNLPRLSLRILIVLLVVGLVARIAITNHAGWSTAPAPGSDSSEFDSYAWNLAQGHGYSGVSPDVKGPDGQPLEHLTAYRSPATSVLWAGMFLSFGHSYTVVRISSASSTPLPSCLSSPLGASALAIK